MRTAWSTNHPFIGCGGATATVAFAIAAMAAIAILWLSGAAADSEFPNRPPAMRVRADRPDDSYVPVAVAQVSDRVALSLVERQLVDAVLRRHIARWHGIEHAETCFNDTDWEQFFRQFDRDIREHLPPSKAIAIISWRRNPAPEGNVLRRAFFRPMHPIQRFLDIVAFMAPADAVDCGACEVTPCVEDALRQQKPFRAVYWERGIDSDIGRGFIGRADGSGILLEGYGMGYNWHIREKPCRVEIVRPAGYSKYPRCE